jgi:hypothetical protein
MITLRPAAGNPPEGHQGEVVSCCYTPDGQFLLSGGWDGHVALWEAASGMRVSAFRVSPKAVSACAAAPDGKMWWTGSLDGILSAWDPITHQAKQNAVVHVRPISAIRFSLDGQFLASASWDRQVVIRPADSEGPVRTLCGHADIVSGCEFTPDGKQLLTWSHDGTLRVWDTEFGRCLHTLQRHEDRIAVAAISPDGRWFVSASRDCVLKVWDAELRAEAAVIRLGEVRACSFLLDGESVLVVDATGWAHVLSVPGLQVKAELGVGVKVQSGAISPSGGQMGLGGEDGRVHFIEIHGLEQASLVINATQGIRDKASMLRRLFGKARFEQTYQYRCPQCQQAVECDALPEEPFACCKCGQRLRLGQVLATHAR